MPKERTLEVIFDLKTQAYEVPEFRAAIIELVGCDNVAFHNHNGDNDFHFLYPTLQYKQNHEHTLSLTYQIQAMDLPKTNIDDAWRPQLKKLQKYKVITPQRLFGPLIFYPKYRKVMEYLNERYW